MVFRPRFHAYRYIDDSLPIDGDSMKRLSDWLWSTNGPRSAAMSMRDFMGSSQAVR